MLAAGEAWGGAGTPLRLTLRAVQTGPVSARVDLCRAQGTKEYDCLDGLDNDCDGLTDEDDLDCQLAALPRSDAECNDDGTCGDGESAATCPGDCPPVCGDGLCELRRNESASSCPGDCGQRCGDGFCDWARGERHGNCSADCPAPVCGNGACEDGDGEDAVSCPQDCCAAADAACGDGTCDAFAGENCRTCPQDCRGGGKKRKPGSAYCCGDGFGCGDARCNKKGVAQCRTTCV